MESGLEYKVFEWLRFPLIVGVVYIHCFGKPFDYDSLDFVNLSGEDIYNLFRVSISKVLTHVCVPAFYFISGFLFFKGLEIWNFRIFKEKLLRRTKSLLTPYLIWNTLFILIGVISCFRRGGVDSLQSFFVEKEYWHLYWDCNEWNTDRINWIGGSNLSTSPYLSPLWFLRDLMVVMLCAPLLYFFLKKLKIIGVLILGISYISGVFINKSGFSGMSFFFFALGSYVKMYNVLFLQFVRKYRYLFLLLSVLLWFVCTLLNGHETRIGNLIYPFYVIVGFLSLMSMASLVVEKDFIRIPKLLVQCSFFIYLSHYVVIKNVCMKITTSIFGENNTFLMFLAYTTTPVLTILACIICYYLMQRFIPTACKIVTGYRNHD